MPIIETTRARTVAASGAAALLLVASPLCLEAQLASSPPVSSSVASPRPAPAPGASINAATWEHGIYTHYLGAAKRWAGPNGTVIEHGNLGEFLKALGARPDELPDKYASEERYNATVLNVLARDGWEVVNCQFVVRSRSDLYTCYFKRPTSRASGG